MHHNIQKIISYHNFYLFFPICKWKEFKLFQLLESLKKKCADAPSIYQEISGQAQNLAKGWDGLGQPVKIQDGMLDGMVQDFNSLSSHVTQDKTG